MSGIVRIEFAAEKCVRTIGLNVGFIHYCVFFRLVILGCLFMIFVDFLTLSLQAVRTENMVDGLLCAVRSFDMAFNQAKVGYAW